MSGSLRRQAAQGRCRQRARSAEQPLLQRQSRQHRFARLGGGLPQSLPLHLSPGSARYRRAVCLRERRWRRSHLARAAGLERWLGALRRRRGLQRPERCQRRWPLHRPEGPESQGDADGQPLAGRHRDRRRRPLRHRCSLLRALWRRHSPGPTDRRQPRHPAASGQRRRFLQRLGRDPALRPRRAPVLRIERAGAFHRRQRSAAALALQRQHAADRGLRNHAEPADGPGAAQRSVHRPIERAGEQPLPAHLDLRRRRQLDCGLAQLCLRRARALHREAQRAQCGRPAGHCRARGRGQPPRQSADQRHPARRPHPVCRTAGGGERTAPVPGRRHHTGAALGWQQCGDGGSGRRGLRAAAAGSQRQRPGDQRRRARRRRRAADS